MGLSETSASASAAASRKSSQKKSGKTSTRALDNKTSSAVSQSIDLDGDVGNDGEAEAGSAIPKGPLGKSDSRVSKDSKGSRVSDSKGTLVARDKYNRPNSERESGLTDGAEETHFRPSDDVVEPY